MLQDMSVNSDIIPEKVLRFRMPDYQQYKGEDFDAWVLPKGLRGIKPFHKIPFGLRPSFVLHISPKKKNLVLSPRWNLKTEASSGPKQLFDEQFGIKDINKPTELPIPRISYPGQYFLSVYFDDSRDIIVTFDIPPVDRGLRDLLKVIIGLAAGALITLGVQQLVALLS